nr:zinc finger, CCHC-type [Tanacetum cinerariifolium]
MQIILEANGLWETIEPNEKTQADNRKDKTAIAFLYQALPEDQLLQITKYKTAKAIWDALKSTLRRGESATSTVANSQIRVLSLPIASSKVISLRSEYYSIDATICKYLSGTAFNSFRTRVSSSIVCPRFAALFVK